MSFISRPFDSDPASGIHRVFHYDPDRDGFTIETIQKVDPILDTSKALYAQTDERARWGDGQHVAHIPSVIMTKLKREGILDDRKAFKRWLNDPDNRAFRTRPGKI